MKQCLFFIILLVGLKAELVYVLYGERPQNEIIIRYIDDKKEGFVTLIGDQDSQVMITENHSVGKKKTLHTAFITGLNPSQRLQFKVSSSSETYSVSTLKEKDFTFCVCGDLYRDLKPFKEGIKSLALENPDFVVFGGDLAYSIHGPMHFPSKDFHIKRYLTFLGVIDETLKKSNGELIPLIVAIGNHDYKKGVDELGYTLFFPKGGKTYFKVDLGDLLDLWILDTGHVFPIEGEQTEFLKTSLEGSFKPFKLAAYHFGAYPSVYSYMSSSALHTRDAFCPLFDAYNLKAAFEHHSHAFKITYPLKNNKVDEQGTVYFGDGCFGVKPRGIKNKKAWYLKEAQAVRHYYHVIISDHITVDAKNLESKRLGEPLEFYPQKSQLLSQ